MTVTQPNAQVMREELTNWIAKMGSTALSSLYEYFLFEKSRPDVEKKTLKSFQSREEFDKWVDSFGDPDFEIERDESLPRPVTCFDDWEDEK